jgi:hypothetical protein
MSTCFRIFKRKFKALLVNRLGSYSLGTGFGHEDARYSGNYCLRQFDGGHEERGHSDVDQDVGDLYKVVAESRLRNRVPNPSEDISVSR